jgi:phosphocarrier protein
MSSSITKTFTIQNEYGLHARPAALFVKCVGEYDAQVMVEKDGMSVSGSSIMGLLTLEGHEGCELKLTAEGNQAEEALAALGELIDSKFGE